LPEEIVGTALALLGRGACLAAVGRSHALHPSILRGVRLIGVNSDNEPEPPDRIWKPLRSDLRPNYLT
jgi:acrylyl-CoA reductase (NADPH)